MLQLITGAAISWSIYFVNSFNSTPIAASGSIVLAANKINIAPPPKCPSSEYLFFISLPKPPITTLP